MSSCGIPLLGKCGSLGRGDLGLLGRFGIIFIKLQICQGLKSKSPSLCWLWTLKDGFFIPKKKKKPWNKSGGGQAVQQELTVTFFQGFSWAPDVRAGKAVNGPN